MKISACGLICNECNFFGKECEGCYTVQGQPFWTSEMIEKDTCPLYDCSINQKGFNSCGECADLPCRMFIDLKDPSISDTEHRESIKQRVGNLRRIYPDQQKIH